MNELQRGANTPVTKENPQLRTLTIGVEARATDKTLIDDLNFGALLLHEGRTVKNEDVIFFNQLASIEDAVTMRDDLIQIDIRLHEVPAKIDSIDVIAWVTQPTRNLRQLNTLTAKAVNGDNGVQLARTINFAPSFSDERAACLLQIYRRDNEWKLRARGDGWRDGMQGVVRSYDIK